MSLLRWPTCIAPRSPGAGPGTSTRRGTSGLPKAATERTKGRYAFVFSHFRHLHRMGLIACHYRAAEWGHKDIELAAHELLRYLDNSRK